MATCNWPWMHSATVELDWDGLLALVIDQVTIAVAVATTINASTAVPRRSLVVTLATLGPLSKVHLFRVLVQTLEVVWRGSTLAPRGQEMFSERSFVSTPNWFRRPDAIGMQPCTGGLTRFRPDRCRRADSNDLLLLN